MKKFFFSHPDITLAVIAFAFLGTLIGFFVWGIDDVVFVMQQSMSAPMITNKQGFDLRSAGTLGLPTATPVAPSNPSPAPTPTSMATSTASSTRGK